EVVHDVAAGQDQDPGIAQRREPGAQVEVVARRFGGVDGELRDGDIGVGEYVGQDGPRAVVEPPGVLVGTHPGGLDGLGDLGGELGRAGRGVVELGELSGEAVEVVDRPRVGHRGHGGRVDV